MASVLKVWSPIANPTTSIDSYLVEEQSCRINPGLTWNDGALGFLKRSPQQEQEQQDE